MRSRQRILLTGGSGLLALNWALAVRDRYEVVLGLHRRHVSMRGVESQWLDLESVAGLARSIEVIRPNVVVHTAGLTSVERCEAQPEMARHVNTDLPENVAMACAMSGIALVHVSTDHLFSGMAALVREDHPPQPINTYGITKADAEARVSSACPGALIVRTNFFGWGPRHRQSFSDALINGLSSGNELTLFDDVFFTPILVETLVNSIHDLLDRKASGIFNVVGDERISKYAFGLRLAHEFGLNQGLIKRGCISDVSGLVKRPHDMSLSNQKATELLGRGFGSVTEQVSKLSCQQATGLFREIQNI